MVKARGSRQAATSQAGSVVRIQSGRGTDAVAVEATPGQQVGSLAALGQVERTGGTETPPDKIAGDPGPVALEALQGRGDRLAAERQLIELVGEGRIRRVEMGNDAIWLAT